MWYCTHVLEYTGTRERCTQRQSVLNKNYIYVLQVLQVVVYTHLTCIFYLAMKLQ
jgi:hypothetical protein